MEFLVDNWLDDLWLVMKIVIVIAIALVFLLNRIDRQEICMTRIEVYDEDAAELIRNMRRWRSNPPLFLFHKNCVRKLFVKFA